MMLKQSVPVPYPLYYESMAYGFYLLKQVNIRRLSNA